MTPVRFFLTLVLLSSCTQLLSEKSQQCQRDDDCARFGNASCDLTTGFCVARDGHSDASVDTAPFRDSGTGDVGQADAADGPPTRTCPDFDNNRVPDCMESLLSNPDFSKDVTGWSAEPDVGQAFDPRDGLSAPGSGSIAVTSTASAEASQTVVRGSFQCTRANELTTFSFVAQALLESGTSDAATTMGATFQFFASDSCTGTASGGVNLTFNGAAVSGWRILQGAVTTPIGSHSLSVRLAVIKPGDRGATRALFDNVLLRAR